MLRALAKNRIDRYSSAKQLAEDFSRTTATLPPDLLVEQLPRATAQQIAQATAKVSAAPRTYTDGPVESLRLPPVPPGTPPAGTYIGPSGFQGPGKASTKPRSSHKRAVGLGVLAAVLVVGALIGGLLLSRGGSDNGRQERHADPDQLAQAILGTAEIGTPEQTEPAETETATSAAIMLVTKVPAETPTIEATEVPADTPVPTETPLPEATETPLPTETPTPEPTDTVVPTETPIPQTPTPGAVRQTVQAQRTAQSLTQTANAQRPTIAPSATNDGQATAQAIYAKQTQTASAKPPTMTPSATNDGQATAQAIYAKQTQTAVAIQPTLPPVPTRTPSPTIVPSPTASPTLSNECGGMQSRLTQDNGARTTLYPNTPTRVRQSADMSSTVLRSIPAGQTFWLLAGPQCVNNVWFWQIQGVDATGMWTGYIGEGQAGSYWIEPFDTGPVQCPGAPAPRLTPGGKGRVTLYPAVPSRVRAEPNTGAQIQTQLQPGTTFDVLSGPVCDEATKIRWWQIGASNTTGWIAEGQAGEYWIEPWQ